MREEKKKEKKRSSCTLGRKRGKGQPFHAAVYFHAGKGREKRKGPAFSSSTGEKKEKPLLLIDQEVEEGREDTPCNFQKKGRIIPTRGSETGREKIRVCDFKLFPGQKGKKVLSIPSTTRREGGMAEAIIYRKEKRTGSDRGLGREMERGKRE